MPEPTGQQLSPLQARILMMLDDSKGRNTIARELGISVQTVRTRIEQIKEKLDVPVGDDIDATLRKARQLGVLTGPMRRNEERMQRRGGQGRRGQR